MRQAVGGIRLKLDSFFKVDEVKLKLCWAVMQREIGNHNVQKCRFA